MGPEFGGSLLEWKRFLVETTAGDAELERYLQRLAGYSLTGSTREQQLTFIWGPGGNGKTVFLNTLKYVLGDYATTASMDTFVASHFDRHPTDLAALMGARLVIATETQEGREWNEQRLKSLSGGDPITARFMRQDFFTYQPQFKLLIAGNHKPAFRNVDPAIRRRLHLVPFLTTPQKVDPDLMEKLRDEGPAILAWMIEGALTWQTVALNPPTAVLSATQEYFDEEDTVGGWLAEGCEVEPDAFSTTADLLESFRAWCSGIGEHAGSAKRLAQELKRRGFRPGAHPKTRKRGFFGITPNDPVALMAAAGGAE